MPGRVACDLLGVMPHRFLVALFALPLLAQVSFQKSEGRINIEIDGKPFSAFYISGEGVRKPYLHPLRAASGTIVTRQWPMVADVPGESHDHPHHRGLWFDHGDVNGVDFWGSDPLAKKDSGARIVVKKIREMKGGKRQGVLAGDFDWEEKDGKVLIHEARRMVFHAAPDRRVIDFDIRLTMAVPVKFGDTKEGSFGIRLSDKIREQKGTGKMVNAQGAVGEKNVWGKPSEWVDYSGTIDGEPVGVAILDHPSNPRHPAHWHVRAYGLFAANIFGLHDFYNDRSKDGSMEVKAGGTLRFRYRVVIHAGDTAAANIAAEYAKYSAAK